MKRGEALTPEAEAARREKIRLSKIGAANPRWAGEDNLSLAAAHTWLQRNFSRKGICEFCGRHGKTDYAFLFHPDPYTRNREDYVEICRRCHMASDGRLATLAKQAKRAVETRWRGTSTTTLQSAQEPRLAVEIVSEGEVQGVRIVAKDRLR